MENFTAWNEVFKSEQKILCVLYLDCDLETCKSRLLKRGETSNRTDDQEEVIKKRFDTFQEQNQVILDNLKNVTKIIDIKSKNSEKEVFEEICAEFDCLLNKK